MNRKGISIRSLMALSVAIILLLLAVLYWCGTRGAESNGYENSIDYVLKRYDVKEFKNCINISLHAEWLTQDLNYCGYFICAEMGSRQFAKYVEKNLFVKSKAKSFPCNGGGGVPVCWDLISLPSDAVVYEKEDRVGYYKTVYNDGKIYLLIH